MASNIGGTKQAAPRQYNRPMPENPRNYRAGITGNKNAGAPPNMKSTFRQRNDQVSYQNQNQAPFTGTNPATFHLKPNEDANHRSEKASTPSLIFDSNEEDERLDNLVMAPRSPRPSGDDGDRSDLIVVDDDELDEFSDNELLDEQEDVQKKQQPRKNLFDMLGDYKPPANWGDKGAVGDDVEKGIFDLKPPERPDPNAVDPRLVGRAEIGIPNPKASVGLRTTGGAAAGAVIGTATGAAVGATFGGIVLASVAVGAGFGSLGFGVGAVIGAGVGLIVGVGLGIAYGRSSAKRAKADYLDTSQQGTVQRASRYGVVRMLMPKQLGRRALRAIKPSSRSWVGRLWNGATGCCKGGKKITMEDRGRNARASEARQDLRYAVASDVAYSRGGPGAENKAFNDNASSDRFGHSSKAQDWVEDFLTPVDALTDRQVAQLCKAVNGYPPDEKKQPKAYKTYTNDRQAYNRQVYTKVHKHAVLQQSRAARTEAAFDKNEGVKSWDFKTIGPDARPGSKAHDIFKRLPQSLQQSLTDGQGVFRDPDTGNNVRITYDNENDEVVIAYNGTAGGTPAFFGLGKPSENAQNRSNVTNYTGGTPPSVKQAVAIGKAVREAVQKYNDVSHTDINVVSTGHSRGGLLATVEAVKNKGKAVTFNPEPMGAGVRDYCGIFMNDRVSDDVDVTVYSTQNEFVSGSGLASGIGTTSEFLLGWLPLPIVKVVPPVIIGKRRILPQAPDFAAHPNQVMHMTNLAGGAHPPRKARMRWGSEVDRGSLYIPEPDREQPKSNRDVFKERTTEFATTQGQMRLIGHPVMRTHRVKNRDLDFDTFEDDLARAAELVLSTRPGDIDPNDSSLYTQALDLAIGLNLQRQRGGGDNAAGGNDLQIAESRNVEEEQPPEQRFMELVISAAHNKELLTRVMNTPMMRTKNFDLDSMDPNKFRDNLAKNAEIFAAGIKSDKDIEPQAITAIQTAINRTMRGK